MFSRLLDAKHQFHGRWRGDTQQIAWGIFKSLEVFNLISATILVQV